jgi:hypothetical protein
MNSLSNKKEFFIFTGKVILTHTITYFIFGLIISKIMDYRTIFDLDIVKNYMRPFDSPWVTAGPFLQPLRGVLYAVGLWPFRMMLLNRDRGWLPIWGIFFSSVFWARRPLRRFQWKV